MCKVVITIPSLIWLRRTVRRWRSRAAEASRSSNNEAPVPAGHVAVSVEAGSGSRRFVVRLAHLNHPAFRELLRQAEEEYGFPATPGPVALPCDEDHLLDVLRRVSSSSSASSCFCGPAVTRRWLGDSWPLLQRMPVEISSGDPSIASRQPNQSLVSPVHWRALVNRWFIRILQHVCMHASRSRQRWSSGGGGGKKKKRRKRPAAEMAAEKTVRARAPTASAVEPE
ncbi:uncharacterized protein LOC133888934 [Phragmites australis]|uniref:uncharacterized protein LOC133888934 n=1 Tax=Phragmites australis TaxID=29695 RepID=UPI002D782A6A|nr:uncharacterized protein LOC133888934 [Phragmites australis]